MKRIDTLYAWIAIDNDGDEGVAGALLPGMKSWMPLIGADQARIESLRPIAEQIAAETGRRITLKKFASGVVIDAVGEAR